MRTKTNKLTWGLMTFLSIGVTAYAGIAYLQFNPDLYAFPEFELHPIGLYTHIIGSMAALLLGPFQFLPRFRQKRYLGVHRRLGRLYLGGVVVGGISGLYMSLFSFGGVITTIGFGMLAIFWLGTAVSAYTTIRQKDVQAHHRWMTRNFALTFAAVTLRLWLPILPLLLGGFEPGYQAVSWVAWVPNLLVAEWLIRRRRKQVVNGRVEPASAQA
jgi:uncharacterized membrane protein